MATSVTIFCTTTHALFINTLLERGKKCRKCVLSNSFLHLLKRIENKLKMPFECFHFLLSILFTVCNEEESKEFWKYNAKTFFLHCKGSENVSEDV